jgi:hypothetical protein
MQKNKDQIEIIPWDKADELMEYQSHIILLCTSEQNRIMNGWETIMQNV